MDVEVSGQLWKQFPPHTFKWVVGYWTHVSLVKWVPLPSEKQWLKKKSCWFGEMTGSLCFLYVHENLVPSSEKVKMSCLVAHTWIPSGGEEEIGGSLGACWSSGLAWSVSFRPKVWKKTNKIRGGWLAHFLHRFWALVIRLLQQVPLTAEPSLWPSSISWKSTGNDFFQLVFIWKFSM